MEPGSRGNAVYRGVTLSRIGAPESDDPKSMFAHRGRIIIYQAAELSSIPTHVLGRAVYRLDITGSATVAQALSAVLSRPTLCFLAEVAPLDSLAGCL